MNAPLPVQDVLAFTDEELVQFMQKHLRPDGNLELPIDGWDKLPISERNCLAERLRYATSSSASVLRPQR